MQKSTTSNISAFRAILDRIDHIASRDDVLHTLGYFIAHQIPAPLTLGTSQDYTNRNKQVLKFFLGDYSLGDRQYYWNKDLGSPDFFKKYHTYLKSATRFWSAKDYSIVPALERRVHGWVSKLPGQADSRQLWRYADLVRIFPALEPILAALRAECPSTDWSSADYAVDKSSTFHLLEKCLDDLSLEQWKAWLSVHLINAHAPYICPETADAHHELFGKTMTGLPERRHGEARWLDILKEKASIPLNEFVREFCLDPRRRREVTGFFKTIQVSTIDILKRTEWLDPPTRSQAIDKVNSLNIDISYPLGSYQFPLTTVAAALTTDCLIKNILILDKADFVYSVKAILAPRHTPWDNPIYIVNAHYWDYQNRIFFPGAILEYPNFLMEGVASSRTRRQRARAAAPHRLGWNYGNLGATLGHEITHAFDLEGMKIDTTGRRREWATDDDKNQYAEKVTALQELFAKVRQDDLTLDTPYIISEAIADLGGLSISLYALKKEMKRLGWSVPRQQEEIRIFFISYAYSWQQKMRPLARIRRVYVDEHPPAWTRVNYIVQHFSDWYESFGINHGRLYLAPEDRIQFFSG